MPHRPAKSRLKAKTEALVKSRGRKFVPPDPAFPNGKFVVVTQGKIFANEESAKRHAEEIAALREGSDDSPVIVARVIGECSVETKTQIEWS